MYIGTRNFHSFSILTENELEKESAWSSMNPVKLKMKFCKKDTWVGVFDRGRWGGGAIVSRPFLRPHLASGGLRFEKCPTLILNYVGRRCLPDMDY